MMKRKETSPDLRQIVIKLKHEGKSLKEIGEILNLSKSTVQLQLKTSKRQEAMKISLVLDGLLS